MQDQLQNCLSHAAWIYFKTYNSSMLWVKQASLDDRKCPSTGIQDQIFWLRGLLYDVLRQPKISLLQMHQTFRPEFTSLHLVHALCLRRRRNV